MLGRSINSEAIIKRLIAEMYQIQADIDEDNERIGDRFDRNSNYSYLSDDEVAKLKEIYQRNELISDSIDREIDALVDVLDKIKKEKDKK